MRSRTEKGRYVVAWDAEECDGWGGEGVAWDVEGWDGMQNCARIT